MVVGIEQHLVRLQRIGAQVERSAVTELEVGYLQLGAHASENSPVLAPVELEGLTRTEGQGNEGATASGLLCHKALLVPEARKGRHTVVGAAITERLQIQVHLLDGAPLLAGSASFRLEPAGELQGEGIELGWTDPLGVVRLGLASAQVLADGVAREARAAGDLPDGQLLSQGPAPDDTQCCHVYHSWSPAAQQSSRLGLVRGSGLDGNPGGQWVTSAWKSTARFLAGSKAIRTQRARARCGVTRSRRELCRYEATTTRLFGFLLRPITEETPLGSFSGTHTEFVADLRAIFLALPLNLLDALGMSRKEIHGFRRLRRATCGQCDGQHH